ncbi:hypothetical protein GmHk_18G052054 [Glycine max]|nr:hypothetical protein GmHk_18G052054 [Glycine max]
MDDMFGRLQVLLTGLKALGYTYTKAQINLKIDKSTKEEKKNSFKSLKVQMIEFNVSNNNSGGSTDNEVTPYDVLLQNCHMISLQCKKYKERNKTSIFENTKLKKSDEDLEKKINALEESLSQASLVRQTNPP